MNILNYTNRSITLLDPQGGSMHLPSMGNARCKIHRQKLRAIHDGNFQVTVNRVEFGDVTGLPDPRPETIYIVSQMVLEVLRGIRKDIYAIDEPVRDPSGRVVGCKGITRNIFYNNQK